MKKILVSAALMFSMLGMAGITFADDDYDERKTHKTTKVNYEKTAKISREKAAEIAQKAVGGIVTDVDFESSHTGKHYYDVEVKKGNQEYDVRIDANTGKVLRQRLDD